MSITTLYEIDDVFTARNDMALGPWMVEVRSLLWERLAAELHDFDDYDFWTTWAQGMTPWSCVDDILLAFAHVS